MIKQAEHLYQTMMADMVHCRQKELGEEAETECCFQICNRYWTKLRGEIAKHEFNRIDDEIFFFKNIKPLFIAEIEYYGLLHHAQLFKSNTKDQVSLIGFWNREVKRLTKFSEENEEFYNYYKSGNTEVDALWFTRGNNDLSNFLNANAFDLDVRALTSRDWMVARIIALEKYENYVRGQMAEESQESEVRGPETGKKYRD